VYDESCSAVLSQGHFSTTSTDGPANKLERLSTCTTCWENQENPGIHEVQDELQITDWNHKENTWFHIYNDFFASELHREQNQACPEESFILLQN